MGEAHVIFLVRNVILTLLGWSKAVFPYWICFTAFFIAIVIVYILYCGNEEGIHFAVADRVPRNMRKVINPFSFDINPQDTSSQDVKCTISTKKNCYILPFWGVAKSDLIEMLQMDWNLMKSTLMENHSTFKSKCLAASPIIRLPVGQQSLAFTLPSSLCLDGRIDPRLFFPLVIVILLEEDAFENIEEPIVFIQATIVDVPAILENIIRRNVQDSESNVPYNMTQRVPTVLEIYVKETHSPTIGVIKKIYDGSIFSENVNGRNVPVCVACCQRIVNVVILPCLHASLCTLCYFRCEICPNCRGPVFNYFTTGPLTEIPQENSELLMHENVLSTVIFCIILFVLLFYFTSSL